MTADRGGADQTTPFPPAVIDALVAAIDINDVVDRSASLPGTIDVDFSAEQLRSGFLLSRQLWREGFDRRALIDLATRLENDATTDQASLAWFKEVRARFKHLRFAFFLYSHRHRSPPMLSLVTLVMGELQDSVRYRGPRDVRRHARRLRLLLSEPVWRLLAREVDRFTPSDPAGYRGFTAAQMTSLLPLLAARHGTAHAFHTARKVVSRQVSLHDDMRVLYPTPHLVETARWLATLNGLMGQMHDDLVSSHAAGTFDYKRDPVTLPDDIHRRLQQLCDGYLATSSSVPSRT